MSQQKQLILVIGATGAQGIAVIDALLAPSANGAPSPYTIRALTRDTESRRAKELTAKGVELVKGSSASSRAAAAVPRRPADTTIGAFDDFRTVSAALNGCYGAYVNTDGFTVGEMKEVFIGIRIFELAKQAKSLRHYVWSGLDNIFKVCARECRHAVTDSDDPRRQVTIRITTPSI